MNKKNIENDFNVGDTVKLISGGPIMTIENNSYFDKIRCQWFAGKKLESGSFPREALIRAEVNEEKQ
jgi:uncharacterized protein YodC (DUF2158 family)